MILISTTSVITYIRVAKQEVPHNIHTALGTNKNIEIGPESNEISPLGKFIELKNKLMAHKYLSP